MLELGFFLLALGMGSVLMFLLTLVFLLKFTTWIIGCVVKSPQETASAEGIVAVACAAACSSGRFKRGN